MEWGKVYLIGAGPGDVALITLKGLRALEKADVVIYDRLINKELLGFTKKDCEWIDAGKSYSFHTLSQDEINELMFERAARSQTVARLKGGDPFLFGRGGEEAEFLSKRGVDVEAVPGISSALGALECAGIPATHRDVSSSFHVYTAHFESRNKTLDYSAIAAAGGTMVFLMGSRALLEIARGLMDAGVSPKTPAAVVAAASYPDQSVWTCTLDKLESCPLERALPAVLVVGEVAGYQNIFNYSPRRRPVLITGGERIAQRLAGKLEERGIGYSVCPVTKLETHRLEKQVVSGLSSGAYTHIAFASPTAARVFFSLIMDEGMDARNLAGVHISAIGEGTAEAVRERGVSPDFVSSAANGGEFASDVIRLSNESSKILVPCASFTRGRFQAGLENVRDYESARVYSMVANEEDARRLRLAAGFAGAVVFMSVGAINAFYELNEGGLLEGVTAITMSAAESNELMARGVSDIIEAETPNLPGVAGACEAFAKRACKARLKEEWENRWI